MENQDRQNIVERIKQNKKLQITAIAIICLIIVLIFYFTVFSNKNTEDTDDYITSLENKLSNTLSSVKGAGNVEVIITVESGMETVIAMKTVTTKTDTGEIIEETPILVNGETVILKEKYPKITGVLIVADGADSILTITKLQQATMSLLDVNINQIEILTGK